MKRALLPIVTLLHLVLGTVATADEIDPKAVIGGAVGGGLGAAAGSYLGGREGAILGSAVGAAAGTTIATHEPHGKAGDVTGRREVVYVTTTAPAHGKKAKGCPPGLKMQGRC